ncbi:hypothetical protein [Microbacterium immunditiarum]|uniref:Uncharacterized protein n=1 Tax=Microbacterium immunditiarum TaxID=337480 RepID=A0A7Y9KJE3_9MICO|nr:hypothetical protein [Microbacterium immunditiarum]NYE18053.1 hypothetical protein [Microbacterium immunditiarum]
MQTTTVEQLADELAIAKQVFETWAVEVARDYLAGSLPELCDGPRDEAADMRAEGERLLNKWKAAGNALLEHIHSTR